MSKQKYNKNEFKEDNPVKFFSNEKISRKFLSSLDSKNFKKLKTNNPQTIRPNTRERYTLTGLSKTRNVTERSERLNTIQTARSNTTERLETKVDKIVET